MREIRTSRFGGQGVETGLWEQTEHHRESEWTYAPDPTGTAPPPDPTQFSVIVLGPTKIKNPDPATCYEHLPEESIHLVGFSGGLSR